MFNVDRLDTRLSRDWIRNGEMRKERIESDTKRKRNTESGDNIRKKISEDGLAMVIGFCRKNTYPGLCDVSLCLQYIKMKALSSVGLLQRVRKVFFEKFFLIFFHK
jgi:hypothetical protein